jgi:hypothetical protein
VLLVDGTDVGVLMHPATKHYMQGTKQLVNNKLIETGV